MNKPAFLLLAFLFLASSASALGISPGRETVYFTPGLSTSIKLLVLTDREVDVQVSVEGDFAGFIKPVPAFFHGTAGGSKEVLIEISIPENASASPGVHDNKVRVEEATGQEGVVGARVGLDFQLLFFVPVPETMLDASFDAPNAVAGERNVFTAFFNNVGSNEAVVGGSVQVFRGSELVASTAFEEKSVASGSSQQSFAFWNAPLQEGSYRAVAKLFFGNESKEFEKNFLVGQYVFDVKDVVAGQLTSGSTGVAKVFLESKWVSEIENVFLTLDLIAGGEKVFSTNSTIAGVSGAAETVLEMDLRQVPAGSYELVATAYFGDRTSTLRKNVVVAQQEWNPVFLVAAIVLAALALLFVGKLAGDWLKLRSRR